MVTTRSKARQLEQATNDRGSNEQSTEGARSTTPSNQRPVEAIVSRSVARASADNNALTHGEDTESNGALLPNNPEESESPFTGSDPDDASKAEHTTGHAQEPSVTPATFETDVPGEPEVLSDATNKAAANTNAANGRSKSRGRRGRRAARPKGRKTHVASDAPVQHGKAIQDAESAGAGSTSADVHRSSETETLTNRLLSTQHDSEEALTTSPSDALPSDKGKGKVVDLTQSSEEGSQAKNDGKTDAVDALLQLWSFRSLTQCRSDLPSNTGAPRPAADTTAPPRRSNRLEIKREEKERKEKEERELERQDKERREREKREKEKEKTKETRSTGDKADDAKTTKKGKRARTPAPRTAANVNKRKRKVADVEDASKEIGPQRKRVAFNAPQQVRNETEHTTHDLCSPSSCSGSSFGPTNAFESSDESEIVYASEAIDVSGTTNASGTMEAFEAFDVKQRIRSYMKVSTLRKTLQQSGYEDPLDGDDASSPAPTSRSVIPPLSGFGLPSQPYLSRFAHTRFGNIWRPAVWRQ